MFERVVAAGCAAMLLTGVAGCQSDAAHPEPTSGPSASGPSTSGTGAQSPSGSDSTPVATGPVLAIDEHGFQVRIRAPRGYRRDQSPITITRSASKADTLDVVLLGYIPLGSSTLPQMVDSSRRTGLWSGKPRRLPDVSAAGQEWYHLVGQSAGGSMHEFGTWHDGGGVWITFRPGPGQPSPGPAMMSQVLASAEWR